MDRPVAALQDEPGQHHQSRDHETVKQLKESQDRTRWHLVPRGGGGTDHLSIVDEGYLDTGEAGELVRLHNCVVRLHVGHAHDQVLPPLGS